MGQTVVLGEENALFGEVKDVGVLGRVEIVLCLS